MKNQKQHKLWSLPFEHGIDHAPRAAFEQPPSIHNTQFYEHGNVFVIEGTDAEGTLWLATLWDFRLDDISHHKFDKIAEELQYQYNTYPTRRKKLGLVWVKKAQWEASQPPIPIY